MNASFSEERSEAIRAGLVAVAAEPRARNGWWRVGGLLAAGVLAGAGATTAAFAAGVGAPTGHVPAAAPPADGLADAPPGVIPGAPINSLLGEPETVLADHATSVDLSQRPAAATHVRVTIACLSAGRTGFGTDAGGNNPSIHCSEDDLAAGSGAAWDDFPVGAQADVLYVSPSRDARVAVTVQFLTQVPTRFGVNANGQTYGVPSTPQGAPDLVATAGTGANGEDVLGYAFRSELDAFSPDHPAMPTSPAEAVRLQAERDAKYPDGWDVPLYESDGTTRIGSTHVG